MAMKTVTQKSQISKWYTKRIKDFTNLTENEALFEYEALKLRERQRKYAKRAGITGYKAPAIPRPSVTISRDVEYLKEFTPAEVKLSATTGFDQLVSPSARIYNYELESWKEENFPGYEARYDYEWHNDYDWVSNDYDESDDYDPLSSILDRAREFIEEIKNYCSNAAGDTIDEKTYRSKGKRGSAKSHQWTAESVYRAKDRVTSLLDSILSSNDKLKRFAERCEADSNYLANIQEAAGGFIYSAYKSFGGDDAKFNELVYLLSDSPMSLADSVDYSYGDYVEDIE